MNNNPTNVQTLILKQLVEALKEKDDAKFRIKIEVLGGMAKELALTPQQVGFPPPAASYAAPAAPAPPSTSTSEQTVKTPKGAGAVVNTEMPALTRPKGT